MKRILSILAVVMLLTSCGGGETETCSTNTTDSTCVTVDSTTTTEAVTVTTDSVSTVTE